MTDRPSAGALRAANQFARHSEHIYRWRSEPQDAERELAEIIDRETKAPEMYELLEEISGAPRYLQGEATVDFASRLLAWWGNGELHTEARRIRAEIDGIE